MRAVISGSPTSANCIVLSRRSVSSDALCASPSKPLGLDRYNTGSPVERNGTPAYIVGRNPQPQLLAPPLVPLALLRTTYPGSASDSLPSPYTVQAPRLGRPNCCEPL